MRKTELKQAIKNLPKEQKLAFLVLEERVDSLSTVNSTLSETDKKAVLNLHNNLLNEVSKINKRIDQIEANYKELFPHWKKTQEQYNEIRNKIEEVHQAVKANLIKSGHLLL